MFNMFLKKENKKQKGFAAFFITILVLVAMSGVVLSIAAIIFSDQQMLANIVRSSQAYYIAEAGLEDVLLRLKQGLNIPASYNFNIGKGSSIINVSNVIGGSRTIISQGDVSGRERKVQIVYTIDAAQISFYYGAQVGDGGMIMGNNSRIKGNLFSNGNVIASVGKGYIDNSVIVANNGNKIKGLEVGQDALVHTCENSTIGGDLTYVSGGSVSNCPAGGTVKSQPNAIEPKDLPISQSQVDEWKQEAQNGGIINVDVVYNSSSGSLGPVQIGTLANPRSLIITNNSHIKITGTVYVTGDILFSNNSIIELDPNSYGSLGGVIIADGNIISGNNAILRGSGQPGSYILILSTSNSSNEADPAILVSNNSQGAIFYTTQGLIYLSNNMKAREVTGYKVKINNNAIIEYESGLENAFFTSGSGASWQVKDWKEVE